jgi:hypothetical protein
MKGALSYYVNRICSIQYYNNIMNRTMWNWTVRKLSVHLKHTEKWPCEPLSPSVKLFLFILSKKRILCNIC